MQTIEVQHHSPEQVRSYIADAVLMAEDSDVPDDLREAVFVEAVRLLASKTVQAIAPARGLLTP